MKNILKKLFIRSVAVIFLITSIGKLLMLFGTAKILSNVDPIFQIQFRTLFLVAAIFELLTVISFAFLELKMQLFFTLWVSILILVYRIALAFVGWRQPCSCLGSFTEFIHISPVIADWAMKILLAYIIIGCVYFLRSANKLKSPI